jgi:hypothetical protein
LAQKDSHTDWSVEELKSTCLAVLSSHPSPICVFIDGLDEICEEDGAVALIRVVDSLRAIPTVKICVASRPEPRFSKRLQNGQHLRLQDLTFNDMRKFAKDSLAPYLGASPTATGTKLGLSLPDSLAHKAEGVFLWLHLAIRSLIRGLDNGDHKAELAQRLTNLPTELSKLYSDMWMRLNEDTQLYRQTTALYLNLLIDARAAEDIVKEAFTPFPSPYFQGRLDLFHFTVATHRPVQTTFLNERRPMPASKLNQLCVERSNAVHLRCAGLVEMVPAEYKPYLSKDQAVLRPHMNTVLSFIHRTAYDFLVDTRRRPRHTSTRPVFRNESQTMAHLWISCRNKALLQTPPSLGGYIFGSESGRSTRGRLAPSLLGVVRRRTLGR